MDKDVLCAFCGATVVARLFVVCSKCDVPMHHECWTANGQCPAFACGATEFVDPAIALFRRATAPVPVEPPMVPVAISTDPDDPARVALRLQRVEAVLKRAEDAMAPVNRRLVGIMIGLVLSVPLGAAAKSPGLLLGSILFWTVALLLVASKSAEPARRLVAARAERDRLDILKNEQV